MANYDYTNYSFEKLREEITRKLIAETEWADVGDSATTQALIQLLAYTADKLHYMIERRSQEMYMPTAILPTSVNALASTLGYLPRRKVSAEGQLGITIVDAGGNQTNPIGNIVIPKHTNIIYNDFNFLTKKEYVITPTDTFPVTLDVIEGVSETKEVLINDPNGSLYKYSYVEIPNYMDIEEDSLEVYTSSQTFNNVLKSINGEPPIESLEFAEPDDLVYDVKISHNGMRILLGDGTNGAKPVGATLYIKYIRSNGSKVEISGTGKKFLFETDILFDDEPTPNQYRYILENTSNIDGGLDEEDIEQIKRNAPNFARTGNRAVTKFDYEYWVKRSGIAGIVDAKTYSEQEVGYNVFNMNNVYVAYLKSDGTKLSTQELQELTTYMDRYQSVTAHVIYVESVDVYLQLTVSAKKHQDVSLSDSEFYETIKQALEDYFKYRDGSLGKSIYLSSLMTYLMDYTVINNGIQRNLLEFVDVVAKAMYEFSTPILTQSQDITITRGNTGDEYVYVINGNTYTYTQDVTDVDDNTLATNIGLFLDGIAEPIDATVAANVITVNTTLSATPFTITNTGSTNLANNYIALTVVIPADNVKATQTEQFIKPGTVEIVQNDGTVLYSDDGAGNIGTGTVNYVTGEIKINTLPDDTYWVRYNQTSVNQFIASKKVVFNYSLPKDSFYDTVEKFSTITIL